MAIKKSELYSFLWRSCDELRGGTDVSLYKDYVLTLLFMKYVSDKYAGRGSAVMRQGNTITEPEDQQEEDVETLTTRVDGHLRTMGFAI